MIFLKKEDEEKEEEEKEKEEEIIELLPRSTEIWIIILHPFCVEIVYQK